MVDPAVYPERVKVVELVPVQTVEVPAIVPPFKEFELIVIAPD